MADACLHYFGCRIVLIILLIVFMCIFHSILNTIYTRFHFFSQCVKESVCVHQNIVVHRKLRIKLNLFSEFRCRIDFYHIRMYYCGEYFCQHELFSFSFRLKGDENIEMQHVLFIFKTPNGFLTKYCSHDFCSLLISSILSFRLLVFTIFSFCN